MLKTVDLRKPHQWFPVARALQRRVIYHAGPTNSGKTYQALQAMRGASSGGAEGWLSGLGVAPLLCRGAERRTSVVLTG